MGKVLITGGSGLLGSKMTALLLERGISVSYLSTQKAYKKEGVEVFYWNPSAMELDEKAFDGVSTVIHLAGAGVGDKRWTESRKKLIIDSRVESSRLLMKFLNNKNHGVVRFIGASAIGYYGEQDDLITEESESKDDFLSHVCQLWEESYGLTNTKIDKLVMRIGLVFAKEGGAYPEMTKTLPFFVGILGSGKQIYSWIHIDDLAEMFIYAINNKEITGTFNAVAPNPISQKTLAKKVAQFNKSIAIPAPKFGLKLFLGEMSSVLFTSQNCSANKILNAGFEFKFERIEDALRTLV